MKTKKIFKKVLPDFIYNQIQRVRNSEVVESLILKIEKSANIDTSPLYHYDQINIDEIFNNKEAWEAWELFKEQLESLRIPDLTGGVNHGDRKALFFIVCYFKPKSVLEIGTHIGASTVNIAAALDYLKQNYDIDPKFSTLDIRDVNCEKEKPWLDFGSKFSPKILLNKLKLNFTVNFLIQDSQEYLNSDDKNYDMIFLDGDHSARTVYREVHKSLERLHKGGIILLHDYFKSGESANPKNKFNSGPYLGVEKYIKEGVDIKVKSFGKLPWKTKYNSKVTSLALILKK